MISSLFKKVSYWPLLFSLFALSFVALEKLDNYTFVNLKLSQSHSSTFKIYWATKTEPNFAEKKSVSLYTNSRKKNFLLTLPVALADINQLRIDPTVIAGVTSSLKSIDLHGLGTETIRLNHQSDFSRFKPNQHLKDVNVVGDTLRMTSTDFDPNLVVKLPAHHAAPKRWLILGLSLIAALILTAMIRGLIASGSSLAWVPPSLLVALILSLIMATFSKGNSHPDELVHLENATYYSNHYLPQEVCSKEGLFTYTGYGVSRLDNREIAYYLGGRFLQLLDFIPTADYIKLRAFNLGLLFILVLLAFKQRQSRLLFLPLLLTPQAWYLFSYYNSDALSLFAMFMAAYQVFVPQSILRRLLLGERPPAYVLGVGLLAVIIALGFWVKLNYIVYPFFLIMLGISWWLLNRRLPAMHNIKPVLIAMCLGTALFLSWEVSRHAINDFDLANKVGQCQESQSDILFNPSTPLNEIHLDYRLKDKGVGFVEMIVNKRWFRSIAYTGLGAYGYIEYQSNDKHYQVVIGLIALLLLYVLLMVSIRGGHIGRLSALSMLVAMFVVAAAAAHHNWTTDYQPQGRYLMVWLPLFGSLMAMQASSLNNRWILVLSTPIILLAIYSFIAVGMVEMLT